MRIDFHPDATAELEASTDWYAQRSQAAAHGFAKRVDEALKKIASTPERFPYAEGRHQVCSVERYPFQIAFRNDSERIYIIAVAHAKRRPGYWRGRR